MPTTKHNNNLKKMMIRLKNNDERVSNDENEREKVDDK